MYRTHHIQIVLHSTFTWAICVSNISPRIDNKPVFELCHTKTVVRILAIHGAKITKNQTLLVGTLIGTLIGTPLFYLFYYNSASTHFLPPPHVKDPRACFSMTYFGQNAAGIFFKNVKSVMPQLNHLTFFLLRQRSKV